jgi:Fe-S oxidoreductase
VAVWAVLVAVSIAGLALRRFVVRPVWLGKVSPESGVIALLIFILMVTYLAGLGMDESTPAARVNWWLHTAHAAGVPAADSAHQAPAPGAQPGDRVSAARRIQPHSAAGGRRGFRPRHRQGHHQASTRCRLSPAWSAGAAPSTVRRTTPARRSTRKKSSWGCALSERRGPGNEAPLLGKHISEEAAFQCTTCGACEFQCPVGIQHLPMIVGLRRGAVNTGQVGRRLRRQAVSGLERNGNSLGFASSERQKFIEKNELPIYDGTQEYCLWLGCMGAYDPQGREIVLALARVLRHLGVTFGVLRKEKCTGDPARRLGNDLLFQQMAEANIEQRCAPPK